MKSTKGETMQVRVLPDVYNELLNIKAELEKERLKPTSFNDALKYLIEKNRNVGEVKA